MSWSLNCAFFDECKKRIQGEQKEHHFTAVASYSCSINVAKTKDKINDFWEVVIKAVQWKSKQKLCRWFLLIISSLPVSVLFLMCKIWMKDWITAVQSSSPANPSALASPSLSLSSSCFSCLPTAVCIHVYGVMKMRTRPRCLVFTVPLQQHHERRCCCCFGCCCCWC